MPVIENIRNLLRQARHGPEHPPAPETVPPAHTTHAFSDPPPRAPAPAAHRHREPMDVPPPAPDSHSRNVAGNGGGIAGTGLGKAYDQDALAKILAQEKADREKLPRHPGLDRWILTQKMGDGAFSNVYRARDSQGVYGEVAIKVVRKYELNASQGDKHLHPDVKRGNKVVERANILKEVSIMRRLDHPNIVKLIDFQEEKAYYYLILELCPGGELFHQIVRLTYFSEELSRHVITQVAWALKHLHDEKGIVHRDIKPENLLFYPAPFVPVKNPKPKGPGDEDKVDEGEFVPGVGAGGIGQIKIADFGLSKVIWEDTTVTPCGTVGYTAPEIVKDERYSKSVDMWALGCVLYTLLCGFPPFYDESISVLTEKVARGQYTFLSPWWDDISKSAQDLVSHLLTVDPEKRYDINQFMQHPWIKNTKEPTEAADDAPPPATPAIAREGLHFISESPIAPETPGGSRRMDFRSPGAMSLREVFDVGYAVLRREEENKRRKGYRNSNAAPLNEEDEAETGGEAEAGGEAEYNDHDEAVSVQKPRDGGSDNMAAVERGLRRANLNASNAVAAGAGASAYTSQVASARMPPAATGKRAMPAAARTGGTRGRARGFELSLDNATLLGRRKRGGGEEAVAG